SSGEPVKPCSQIQFGHRRGLDRSASRLMLEATFEPSPEPVSTLTGSRTTRIVSVAGAHPPNHYTQDELLAALRTYWGAQHHNPARTESLHRYVCVGESYLALPMEEYARLSGLG